MNRESPVSNLRGALGRRWQALTGRERLLVSTAIIVLAMAVIGSQVLAPAWVKWREAPARLAAARAQWEQIQLLAAESVRLQGPEGGTPPTPGGSPALPQARDQAAGLDETTRVALQRALSPSGSGDASRAAQVSGQGRDIIVQFTAASPEGVREALRLARQGLQVRLIEAELQPSPDGAGLRGRLKWEWTGP